MGVDYYHCDDCKECLHRDCMETCVVCEEFDLCDRCVDEKNYVINKKQKYYICDECLYNKSNDKIIYGLDNYGSKLSDEECIKELERIKKSKDSKKEHLQHKLNEIKYKLSELRNEKKRILEEISKL